MRGMLPLPESPVLYSSAPYLRHRQTASTSSGPHSPSPLALPPMTQTPEAKDKDKATTLFSDSTPTSKSHTLRNTFVLATSCILFYRHFDRHKTPCTLHSFHARYHTWALTCLVTTAPRHSFLELISTTDIYDILPGTPPT